MASHEETESVFLRHVPCDSCGSTDANSLYSDGHQFCFACNKHVKGDGEAMVEAPRAPSNDDLLTGPTSALAARGISEETCKKFRYISTNDRAGKRCQAATYFGSSGSPVAQKLRYADKSFKFIGTPKHVTLFGQQLWKGGGKKLVITEGEIDCLTVSQVQANKWPVVSVPNGASAAKRDIAKQIEFVSSFDEIIIYFDDDEPGREAAAEVAAMLPPGKAFIASIPGYKDANEALLAGKADLIINAIWNPKPYRPDGLVSVTDLHDELEKPLEMGLPYWDERLTKLTYGRRLGEVVGIGAGTGVGKTDWITQQVAFDIMELKLKVGTIFLEQQPKETALRIAGKIDGACYHVPGDHDLVKRRATLDAVTPYLTMYDSFGQADWDIVASKIRYMANAQGIQYFYLDHLTAMADTADERGSLEQIMKELAGLANELKVWILFVSHLATPEGRSHEEGGHVSIRHFKGARAIGFWAYFMFGLERNQQAEDVADRSITTFRVLKDRYTGRATGSTLLLSYDTETMRQVPVSFEEVENDTTNPFGSD